MPAAMTTFARSEALQHATAPLDGDAGENRHPGVDHRAEEKDGWELQPLAALEP